MVEMVRVKVVVVLMVAEVMCKDGRVGQGYV